MPSSFLQKRYFFQKVDNRGRNHEKLLTISSSSPKAIETGAQLQPLVWIEFSQLPHAAQDQLFHLPWRLLETKMRHIMEKVSES